MRCMLEESNQCFQCFFSSLLSSSLPPSLLPPSLFLSFLFPPSLYPFPLSFPPSFLFSSLPSLLSPLLSFLQSSLSPLSLPPLPLALKEVEGQPFTLMWIIFFLHSVVTIPKPFSEEHFFPQRIRALAPINSSPQSTLFSLGIGGYPCRPFKLLITVFWSISDSDSQGKQLYNSFTLS